LGVAGLTIPAWEGKMRPSKRETTAESDPRPPTLDRILDPKHGLVQLGGKIDWAWIDGQLAPLQGNRGRSSITGTDIASRFGVGLLLLEFLFGLSAEDVQARWLYDPYFQHFTGERVFQHSFPHSRADLDQWRRRADATLEQLQAGSLQAVH
jgi:transposase, IS5 family